MLGELKHASTEIGIGSRPAYFHAMYREALQNRAADTTAVLPTTEPQQIEPDARAKMIADAESRGIVVPDYIRRADVSAVNQWWAALIDGQAAA